MCDGITEFRCRGVRRGDFNEMQQSLTIGYESWVLEGKCDRVY